MHDNDITDPLMRTPVLTIDGRPWVQRCFVCARSVNFLKSSPEQRVKVGSFVRHYSCDPTPLIGQSE